MKKYKLLIIIFVCGIFACDRINPPEDIPAYIHIDSFTLNGNYSVVGSLSHSITDAWVYVDNEFIGVFELPSTFPILRNGKQKILLRAGIKENGISNTRIWYPFYEIFSQEMVLTEKLIDTINPTTQYLSNNIQFFINEDFEYTELSIETTDNSTVEIERTNNPDEVFEKDYSMKATIIDSNDFFEIQTKEIFELPRNKAIFLEVNFKTDLIVSFGYYAISSSTVVKHSFFNFNPTNEWKKVYINLGNEILYETADHKYFQLFWGTRKGDNPDSFFVFFDNLKLISFE